MSKKLDTTKMYRLMYLRRKLDENIDHFISEYLMRGDDVDTELIKGTLMYYIDDNLDAFNQDR